MGGFYSCPGEENGGLAWGKAMREGVGEADQEIGLGGARHRGALQGKLRQGESFTATTSGLGTVGRWARGRVSGGLDLPHSSAHSFMHARL